MSTRVRVAAAVLIAPALLAGCRDRAKEISSPEHLLARQHKVWASARESLHSDQPNLGLLRSVDALLGGRTLRRVEKEYPGSNKAEVVALLTRLRDGYSREIMSRLDLRNLQVRLKAGATMDQVRDAFDSLDKDYLLLEAMTGGKD